VDVVFEGVLVGELDVALPVAAVPDLFGQFAHLDALRGAEVEVVVLGRILKRALIDAASDVPDVGKRPHLSPVAEDFEGVLALLQDLHHEVVHHRDESRRGGVP